MSFWLLYGKIVSTVCLWHLDKHIPKRKKGEKIGTKPQQDATQDTISTVFIRCVLGGQLVSVSEGTRPDQLTQCGRVTPASS